IATTVIVTSVDTAAIHHDGHVERVALILAPDNERAARSKLSYLSRAQHPWCSVGRLRLVRERGAVDQTDQVPGAFLLFFIESITMPKGDVFASKMCDRRNLLEERIARGHAAVGACAPAKKTDRFVCLDAAARQRKLAQLRELHHAASAK